MRIIEHAKALLLEGKLVAIPTETVYGLGADAKNPKAIQRVYAVKGRPTTNPLIIHIPNQDAMSDWAIDIPIEAYRLANAFWPGPLTLILKRNPCVPKIVTGGQETVALRVPNHSLTLELLHHFKGGIAAPSANRYGRISPTTAKHVQEELGQAVDYILDGGPCTVGIESTIVYMVDATPFILRQGHISKSAIEAIIKHQPLLHNETPTITVPGSSASHYAPTKPLYLLYRESLLERVRHCIEKNKSVCVLSFFEKPESLQGSPGVIDWVCLPLDPTIVARQLYHQLREFDKNESHCILVQEPPDAEAWLAIKDRLQRAARPED